MKKLLFGCSLLLLVASISCSDNKDYISSKSFITEARRSGILELSLGKLAIDKSRTYDVRKYAQQIISDYTSFNAELESLASAKKVSTSDTLDSSQQDVYNTLNAVDGFSFDKQYIDIVVAEQKADISRFEEAAGKVDDAEVRKWAKRTLPILQNQYKQALVVQAILKDL